MEVTKKQIGRSLLPSAIRWLAIALAMVGLQNPAARAQEKPGAAERIEGLIAQLESASFAAREQATAELLEIGEPVVAYLDGLSGNATFEARQRCLVIEQKIEEQIFQHSSRKFLLDLDPTRSYGLPGWDAFRELVGATRTSKLLFLEMLEHEREFVTLVERVHRSGQPSQDPMVHQANKAELLRLLTKKSEGLQLRLYTAPRLGESLGILFAAAVLDEATPVEVNRLLASVTQMSFYGYLGRQGYSDCLKKLLSAWLPKTHAAMAPEAMRLALGLNLPVAAPIARQHLSKNFDVATRALAFHCLAEFGDATDVPTLLKYAEETTIVEEFSDSVSGITEMRAAPPLAPFVPDQDESLELHNKIVRINDFAAASAMLLLDEDPRAIFPNYSPDKLQLIYAHDLAISEQDSAKQIALIQAWAREHASRAEDQE